MFEFERLDDTALLDVLANYTAHYTKMIADGAPRDEAKACRDIIQSLQSEIEYRKKNEPSRVIPARPKNLAP